MYNLFEAKKIGESSPFVGTETKMIVFRPGPEKLSAQRLNYAGEVHLKQQYERYGPQPIRESFTLPGDAFNEAVY